MKQESIGPKKICMVAYLPTPTYLPPMFNGAHALAEKGFQVEILCITSNPSGPALEEIRKGLIVRYLFLRSMKYFQDLYGLSPKSTIKAAIQYVTTFIEFNVKAVIAGVRSKANLFEAHDLPTLLPAFIASVLAGKPLAYHAHEMYAEMHEKVRFARLWKFIERLIAPFADVVVTPEDNRSRILHEESGVKELPLTVRNCPPFTPPIQSTKLRDVLAERGHFPSTIVLYQGLFDNSRCMHEMIRAAEFFNDGAVLVLVGSGFDEWKTPEKVIGDSKKVIVLPRVGYTELSQYTASADIGMLFYRNNCRNNYYCAPNKVHEYMMMGLPVVTNNYPGIAALVDGEGIGISVDAEQPKEIAAAVNAMAADRQRYEKMKERCLVLSKEKYNWEKEFEKLLQRYDAVL
jgi:glycosyltransferase involved in cell wall biosynthesis